MGRSDYKNNKENLDQALEKMRKIKGCYGIARQKAKLENIEFHTCMGNFYHPSARSLIDVYYKYQNGVMPFSGPYMEQPAKILEIFEVLEGLINEQQRELERKSDQEEKRKARNRRLNG